MRYTIEGDSLPAVFISLEPGEKLVSEVGGRIWTRGDIVTETSSEGGIGKMFGRMLTGENLMLSTYTAQGAGEIAFASSFPGSILAKELGAGEVFLAQKSAFLCATYGVEMSVEVNKSASSGLLGGEGFLMQKFTGPGVVFLEVDGYCKEYDLAPGERIVCDTGLLAAMDSSVTMTVEAVKGLKNKLLGGEGLVDTVLTGPGHVYLQTMTVPRIAQLISTYLPKKS